MGYTDGVHGVRMFLDMLPEYEGLSQRDLNLFVQDRRPIRKLLDKGFKKVGNLKGITEKVLEEIVGADFMPRFYTIEQVLVREPENWLPEVWKENIDTRRGQIVMKTVLGNPRSTIADEEGVSGERIRQMTEKFFLGQEPFLEIIDDKTGGYADQEELAGIFPDKTDLGIFLVWKQLRSRKRSGVFRAKSV